MESTCTIYRNNLLFPKLALTLCPPLDVMARAGLGEVTGSNFFVPPYAREDKTIGCHRDQNQGDN